MGLRKRPEPKPTSEETPVFKRAKTGQRSKAGRVRPQWHKIGVAPDTFEQMQPMGPDEEFAAFAVQQPEHNTWKANLRGPDAALERLMGKIRPFKCTKKRKVLTDLSDEDFSLLPEILGIPNLTESKWNDLSAETQDTIMEEIDEHYARIKRALRPGIYERWRALSEVKQRELLGLDTVTFIPIYREKLTPEPAPLSPIPQAGPATRTQQSHQHAAAIDKTIRFSSTPTETAHIPVAEHLLAEQTGTAPRAYLNPQTTAPAAVKGEESTVKGALFESVAAKAKEDEEALVFLGDAVATEDEDSDDGSIGSQESHDSEYEKDTGYPQGLVTTGGNSIEEDSQRTSQQDSQLVTQGDSQVESESQQYRWTPGRLKVMISWMKENRGELKGKQLDWCRKLKDEKFRNDSDITVSRIKEKTHNIRTAYTKARKLQAQSGQIRPEDNANSFNALLNRKCPFFWELDNVWGDRPHIVPPTRSGTPTGPSSLDGPEFNDHDDNAAGDQTEDDNDIEEWEISRSNGARRSTTHGTRDIRSRPKTPSARSQSTITSKRQNTSRIDQASFDHMNVREEIRVQMEERRLRLEEDRMTFEREKLAAKREARQADREVRQAEITALKDIILAALSAGSRGEATERRAKRLRYSRLTSRRRSRGPASLASHSSRSRSGSPSRSSRA